MDHSAVPDRPTFIDLFSGCGGLSLGLSQSGWQGVFAVERAADAFETFRANFLGDHARFPFKWPSELPQTAHSIDGILDNYLGVLESLRGKVDLIAGGPPCQGFSFAGRRNSADPRNKLFHRYVSVVDVVKPKFLVLENVPGMNVAHSKRGNRSARSEETFYDKLRAALCELGYSVGEKILDAADHGVPQRRERLVVVGIRADIALKLPTACTGVFNRIDLVGQGKLALLGGGVPVSAKQALSDLQVGMGATRSRQLAECVGSGGRGRFWQLRYKGPRDVPYQKLMNAGVAPVQMDSMRLANHRPDVEARFQDILDFCRRGSNLSKQDREAFGMLKHRTVPMAPGTPAPTLTTLPDDILHYREPRILTVREYARLQSFPDWFEFKGKYTTGGVQRKVECPRYTQVGNAVPPLLAQSIGTGLLESWRASTLATTAPAAGVAETGPRLECLDQG
jgi:DNA (cytosine-5)-methyltransferase 1